MHIRCHIYIYMENVMRSLSATTVLSIESLNPTTRKKREIGSTRSFQLKRFLSKYNVVNVSIVLATKWLRILLLRDIDKIRNHLVVNPILVSRRHTFRGKECQSIKCHRNNHSFLVWSRRRGAAQLMWNYRDVRGTWTELYATEV